jgi:hypothetical protein
VRPGTLFYITDSLSQNNFLVDTGSTFSILPFKSSAPQSSLRLTAANGRRIACWGHCRISVVLDGVLFKWRFLKAAVKLPILGADFLRHFCLLVDVAGRLLIPLTISTAPPTSEPAAGGHLRPSLLSNPLHLVYRSRGALAFSSSPR